MMARHSIRGALALVLLAPGMGPVFDRANGGREIRVSEIRLEDKRREESSFSRPVSIAHGDDAVYVVDADDNTIRVFTKDGTSSGSFGQKGQAPGEFDSPADLDFRNGRLYIADRFNKRIQILDRHGKYLEGFKVPFSPDQICVPEDGKIVVSHLPRGAARPEPMVHC